MAFRYVLAVERQIAKAVLLSSQNMNSGAGASARSGNGSGASGNSISSVRCISLADAHYTNS